MSSILNKSVERKTTKEFISQNIDKALLFIGLAGLIVPVLIIRNPQSIVYPTVIVFSSLVLVIFKNKSHNTRLLSVRLNPRVLSIIYFVVLTTSVISYVNQGYSRTLFIHFCILSLYMLSFLLTFSTSKSFFDLIHLFIAGIIHRTMIQFSSTLPFGGDPLFHLRVSRAISNHGDLSPLVGEKYYFAPFYHLNIAIDKILFDLPIRITGYIFIVTIMLTIPPVCIFVLLREYWSEQIGFIGAFLFITADYTLRWSVRLHVVSMGIVLFSLCVFCFVRYFRVETPTHFGLLIGFYIVTTLTHQASSFIILVGVGLFSASFILYESTKRLSSALIVAAMTGLLFFDWMVTKIGVGQKGSFFDLLIFTTFRKVNQVGATSVSRADGSQDIPFSLAGASHALTVPHVIGPGLLFGLGIIGGIYWMRRDSQPFWVPFSALTATGGMYFFVFVGPLIGFDHFQSGRWVGYTYVLLSLVGAPAVGYLIQVVRSLSASDTVILIFILLTLGPYVSLMGANANGSPDGALLPAPGSEELSFDKREEALLLHADEYSAKNSRTYSDFRATLVLQRFYSEDSSTITIQQPGMSL